MVRGVTFNGISAIYYAELLALQNSLSFPNPQKANGYFKNFGSGLSTTNPGSGTLRIADGVAMVQGRLVLFSDTTDFSIQQNGYVILTIETNAPEFARLRFSTIIDLVKEDMFVIDEVNKQKHEVVLYQITNYIATIKLDEIKGSEDNVAKAPIDSPNFLNTAKIDDAPIVTTSTSAFGTQLFEGENCLWHKNSAWGAEGGDDFSDQTYIIQNWGDWNLPIYIQANEGNVIFRDRILYIQLKETSGDMYILDTKGLSMVVPRLTPLDDGMSIGSRGKFTVHVIDPMTVGGYQVESPMPTLSIGKNLGIYDE